MEQKILGKSKKKFFNRKLNVLKETEMESELKRCSDGQLGWETFWVGVHLLSLHWYNWPNLPIFVKFKRINRTTTPSFTIIFTIVVRGLLCKGKTHFPVKYRYKGHDMRNRKQFCLFATGTSDCTFPFIFQYLNASIP